jgi:hypothetical protein
MRIFIISVALAFQMSGAAADGLQSWKVPIANANTVLRLPIQSNICQTVCQNGRTIQVTCNGQQNCCANAIACRVWCTSNDASTCSQ